ncbi:hypothetical protein JCM17380_12590 [Desulfosporosinus burensis]|uniref:hypothetical protein n=1 Tax=Desulfosporosinus sp. BICA1-9 TaxID=1531958 RepID=UPI00054C6D2A|nr:hypothetical protein [Desulfosporosinus sp. BICA1-9]KJS90036.1 MAG: hypothetical protein JL57_04200 [Desulfosporosinus sp. BICA1-9]HBW36444.1 hypothetical protein [Desulfosporosinus sp.]
MVKKTAQALWQDYRFLTKEMMKFLTKQDMALFYDLMNQREQLQTLIEQTPDDGFKVSPVGRSLISEIQQDSQAILHAMQVRLGSSKRQHQVSEAYGAASTMAISQMKWKR